MKGAFENELWIPFPQLGLLSNDDMYKEFYIKFVKFYVKPIYSSRLFLTLLPCRLRFSWLRENAGKNLELRTLAFLIDCHRLLRICIETQFALYSFESDQRNIRMNR